MDSWIASIAVAAIAGIPGVLGLVFQQVNRRRERDEVRSRELAAKPDKVVERQAHELDQCWGDNDDLREQLRKADHDKAKLRAKHQQLAEDYDSLMGENRRLRQSVEDLRTKANCPNIGEPS